MTPNLEGGNRKDILNMKWKTGCIWGVSQNEGYHFRGHNNEGHGILGAILGSPYLGELLYGWVLGIVTFIVHGS